MSALKDAKVLVVEEISNNLKESQALYVINYATLDVVSFQEIRKELAPNNALLKVYKNRLVKQALKNTEYANINEVLKYKGEAVYIKKDDLKLERGEVLDEDLIGMKVFMNGEEKGKVSKVLREKQDRLVVVNDRGKYYIPYVKGVVKEINLKEGIILEDISGLFD